MNGVKDVFTKNEENVIIDIKIKDKIFVLPK